MIFVIAAIFILVVSFVIALVSLIREQSKIEKAAADASLDADRINVQEHQTVENKVLTIYLKLLHPLSPRLK